MVKFTAKPKDKDEASDSDKEDDGEESSTSGASKFSLLKKKLGGRLKRKKGKQGKKTNATTDEEGSTDAEADTDGETGTEGDDPNSEAEDGEHRADQEGDAENVARTGGKSFENTDVKQNVFVTVRVIEARDIRDSGNLRARVRLDGRTKATRVTTELHPKWQQNLNFALETTLEKAAMKTITLQAYAVRRVLSDKLLGSFDCPMAMIMHQSGGAILNKWIALAPPPKDGKRAERDEDVGFIKVSIAVYSAGESPPMFRDDDDSNDIFNSAHFAGYTLVVRLHRLLQLVTEVRENIQPRKGKGPDAEFTIKVIAGDQSGETTPESFDVESKFIPFNEEVALPFLWPTVIHRLVFHLIMTRGKKKTVVAQSSIALRDIYAPGEEGYLPSFGPAFLNFYGPEKMPQLRRFRRKLTIPETDNCKFYGRILAAVECVDFQGDQPEVAILSHAAVKYGLKFERLHHYSLFATMTACNKINPRYASDNVSFLLSMGNYGSNERSYPLPRSSTHPSMPDYDDCRDFCMGWGNHEPLLEIGCLWENVHHRVERSNAISAVATMVEEVVGEVAALGGQKSTYGGELVVEGLEWAGRMLASIQHHQAPKRLRSHHDFLHQETRQRMIAEIREELLSLKDEHLPLEKAVEEGTRCLARAALSLRKLARDAECTLPDILIKMVASEKVVAYARISPAEIMHSEEAEALAGRYCGLVRPVQLMWMDGAVRKKSQDDQVPAVLHIKMWMGRHKNGAAYIGEMKPAEPKCFWEVYHYQTRTTSLNEWGTLGYFDFRGHIVDPLQGPVVPDGWLYSGDWQVRNTHERWIPSEKGRVVYDDKLFELQERTAEGWTFVAHTDVWGAKISQKTMSTAPNGWKYEGSWARDFHSTGDKEGWMYSVGGQFDGSEANERAERLIHMFRRRVLTRTRKRRDGKPSTSGSILDVQANIGIDDNWEYATKQNGVFHDKCMPGDRARRRRFVAPVVKNDDPVTNYNAMRQFEIHDVVSQWQLRAYVFWGKDLLPVTKDFSSRAFVRFSYLHHTKQTAVVDRTANPVFNESLVFDKLLIPGSHNTIIDCPPSVFVDVRGERHDDSECFLGRFTASPTVICSATERRAKMRWFTLSFGQGRTRGSLLCAFELFLRDTNHKVELPLMPAKKKTSGIEVPAELRPKFSKYSVQMLCWGVRNLQRHNLLTVRRPFISMIFGDSDAKLRPLRDVKDNPNFDEPLVTFQEVMLPDELELAPPLVLNLHDQRAFRRQPLVGVCLVSDYRKYVKTARIQKQDQLSDDGWQQFEDLVELEDAADAKLPKVVNDEHLGDYRIDWWSKFYYSDGHSERAPGFKETGIESLRIFPWPLEDTKEYGRFKDFLDTFQFKKSARGHFDDHEEKELTGELKGRLFLRKYEGEKAPALAQPSGVEFPGVTACRVRLYVVAATGLINKKTNRACDSYVMARIGKKKISRIASYSPDNVDPEYGELIEFEVELPLEKDLVITVMNRRRIIRDEEIGSTTIDLEDRLLTRHRATVALSQQYTTKGDLVWRDQLSPLSTLRRYCRRMQLPPPRFLGDAYPNLGLEVLGVKFMISDIEREPTPRPRVGSPVQRVALFVLHKMGLVPEHVESRPLFDSHGGKQEVGRIRCWVDIFPLDIGPVPRPIDISVRRPEQYQIRIAIFNVFNAVVCKRNFQQPCGDLYVKAFLNGQKKGQKTDVHYRVLDGFASFNYRLILDFDWNPWEKKIYAKEKKRLFRKSRTELTDSLLILQLWDNNKFSKDTLLGELVVDLQGFQEGMMDPDEIQAVYYPQVRYRNLCARCCRWSWARRPALCCNRKRKEKLKLKETIPLPKAPLYKPPNKDDPYFRPFEGETLRGYFPMLRKGAELPNEQKVDHDAKKKKNDDYAVLNPDKNYVTGVVEMEVQLLPKHEADREKVGLKRKKPNHSPTLEKPDRSTWDSHWLLSRIRPALRHFWHTWGKPLIVWLVIILLIVLVVASILYNLPLILERVFASMAELITGE